MTWGAASGSEGCGPFVAPRGASPWAGAPLTSRGGLAFIFARDDVFPEALRRAACKQEGLTAPDHGAGEGDHLERAYRRLARRARVCVCVCVLTLRS